YLKSNQEDKNLLILGSSSRSSFTNKLSAELSNLRSITQANKDYLQRSDLEKMLDKEKPNWVIIETDDLGAINNAISNLNAIRSKYEIRIFTSDLSKINAAEVESEYLSHLNFTYTSVDRSDTARESNVFVQEYLKKYGVMPSSYAIRGFDVTLDAILRLAFSKDIFKGIKKTKGYTEYVENRFDYKTKSANGFYNNAVYLLKFDENLQLKVIN